MTDRFDELAKSLTTRGGALKLMGSTLFGFAFLGFLSDDADARKRIRKRCPQSYVPCGPRKRGCCLIAPCTASYSAPPGRCCLIPADGGTERFFFSVPEAFCQPPPSGYTCACASAVAT